MKIVLNPHEVNRIIIEYLISEGKLDDEDTDVRWIVDKNNLANSLIVFEQ